MTLFGLSVNIVKQRSARRPEPSPTTTAAVVGGDYARTFARAPSMASITDAELSQTRRYMIVGAAVPD